MTSPAQLLQEARQLHKAGKFAQAQQIYQQILQADPQNAGALHLLGLLALDSGRADVALNLIGKALAQDPYNADYLLDMGGAHRASGQPADAQQCFEIALMAKPGFVNAMLNLAVLFMEQGRLPEAEAQLREAIRREPASAVAWNNLGNLFLIRGDLAAARSNLEKAVELDPGYAEALNGLGSTFQRQDELAKSLELFEKAIALKPGYVHAHYNLAVVLHTLGNLARAEASFRTALQLRPDFAQAHYQLAAVYRDAQQFAQAETYLQNALRLRPTFLQALSTLATVQEFQGKYAEARAAIARALGFQASDELRLKAALTLPVIYESNEQIQQERSRLEKDLAELAAKKPTFADVSRQSGGVPFFLAYQGHNDIDILSQLATLYAQAAPDLRYVASHCATPTQPSPSREPIRVGFLSRFFYRHTIGKLNAGLIRNLPRKQFHVTVFRFPGTEDSMSQAIAASANQVVTLPARLDLARNAIADQKLDALIFTDIGMDPLTYFLAFARLAPVQCASWGHPVTTGIPTVDYFLSNKEMEPENADQHYSERLVRFGQLNTCYDEPRLSGPAKQRADFNLPDNAHLYLCTQSLYKIHPDFDAVLQGILQGDPDGIVVLLAGPQEHWTELIKRRFGQSMPDMVERIHFLPQQPQDDFLHLQSLADVLLDTFPFCGGNTSLEAFAFGTPIVTLATGLMRGRITYACYRQMGIDECIATTTEQYVSLALRLGTDAVFRENMRKQILERKHLLFDNHKAVDDLAQFLLQAVEKARMG